ncbi:MAG: helix-turn-helix transcriptional regulator [bacterium]|nr:helix-turn-helix transcriptional regulator [bacterium]
MENLLGSRIKELRSHYNLSVKEFATRCGLSHVAIFHLESGRTLKPHRSSLQRIASIFGTTTDWLLFGRNEMLPQGDKEIYTENNSLDSFWKDEAYLEIKSKNVMLEKEVERLWQMLSHFTSGTNPNFQRILDVG